MTDRGDIGWLADPAGVPPERDRHGLRAELLGLAGRTGLSVPPGFVLPFETVEQIAESAAPPPGLDGLVARLETLTDRQFDTGGTPLLLAVRPSAPDGRAGGMVPAVLGIGAVPSRRAALAAMLGSRAAATLERHAVQSFGVGALGLEGDDFEFALHDALRLAGAEDETGLSVAAQQALVETCRALIAEETGAPCPDTGREQLAAALVAMARNWRAPRAQRRRALTGGDPEAPLALIVQALAVPLSDGAFSGTGSATFRDDRSGAPRLSGLYLPDSLGDDATLGLRTPRVLTSAERTERGLSTPALEDETPDAVTALRDAGARLEAATGDASGVDFALIGGALTILDVRRVVLGARAAVTLAVDLAEAGTISRADAVRRVSPAQLDEHLHPTIDPSARRDILGAGLPASPGAVSGALVFTPDRAEALAAEGRVAILALTETGPEDIRGMHAAGAVLTVRGGMTSHAAVVARGLGKPCVVGARDLRLDRAAGRLTGPDGRVVEGGSVLTVDGTTGQILVGAVPTRPAEMTGAFATLMDWADSFRRLGVRANADTAEDAATARDFGAGGIGLCRTEHMFFQRGRILAMREMILAETEAERRSALHRLLPMQQADFAALFRSLGDRPVTIRLLDPPLHEFLPHGAEEIADLARRLGVEAALIEHRAADLAEFNPMLGKRGCRLGIIYPEIYRMQSRAIFLAAAQVRTEEGITVRPEIMVPLVSVHRELQIVAEDVAEVARDVAEETGVVVDYEIGVMIETPRAALRAGDIAADAGFLSLGTNDLTQMLFGLSRDDAGRFMPEYLGRGVFGEDPFHALDTVGVGEIMRLAIERARAVRPGISIGLCGEHGGDPRSIAFCESIGVDYVSCSPFRVPIARLAAAQAALVDVGEAGE